MRKVIIYDDRNPEKEPLFREEMKRQGIEHYEVFPAIILKHSVVESISASFKAVIQSAKDNKEEMIAICEDDIFFTSDNSWKYFIENIPKEFDIYIGGTYLIDNRIKYEKPIVKVPAYIGNHCIIVHERYYDKWLATDEKQHCDGVHDGNGDFYVCFPFPALQRAGMKSANHSREGVNMIVNYNTNITMYHPEFIYK